MKSRVHGSALLLGVGAISSASRACAFLSIPPYMYSYPNTLPRRQLHLSSSSFGLTDDGDFFIGGINGEESVSNTETTATPSYLSTLSLGSADSIGDISSVGESSSEPAGDGSESRQSTAQRNLSDFVGLNDDGDFLMVGINGNDPLEIATQDEEEHGSSPSQSMPAFGLKLTSADDSIDMAAVQRFREQSEVAIIDKGARAKESAQLSGNHECDEAVEAVGEWLSEIIPTLRDADNLRYSQELVAIGFDPGCVTQCELTWEDLSFMKLLHRRYLYNEITGQDHPWEA